MPPPIITVADLGTYLTKSLTTDNKAVQAVAAINAWVYNYTGRAFGGTITILGEYHDYHPVVWTDHQDVTAVAAIYIGYPNIGRQAIPAGNYFFNEFGRIMLNPGGGDNASRGNYDLISVDYTFGVATVPADLKMASLGLAADFYNDTGSSQGAITMAMVGQFRLMYKGADIYTPIFDSYRTKRT